MKIGLFSDIHLGFGQGTERERDAFENLEEAMEMCKDCDLILIAGDIFDYKTPNAEILTKTMENLLSAFGKKSETKILEGINKDLSGNLKFGYGIPVISIYGNHERRSKGLLNPVEALERAGFLVQIHCNGLVLEKDGIKIAIQGMGGVPDQFAERILKEWNPKPKEEAYNILMLHQSISGFVFAEHLLPQEAIPKGFDLYINGHIHEPKESTYDGKPFIHPGGLVVTQITSQTQPIRVYKIDVQKTQESIDGIAHDNIAISVKFEELKNQRKTYYLKFENPEDVEKKLQEIFSTHHIKKPLVKIKLKEKIPIEELKIKYGDKGLLYFGFEKGEDKIEGIGIQEQELSVQELGKKLLRENLEKQGLDVQKYENVFELLINKKQDKVVEMFEE